jgi:predicted HTH transcriptional regulator
VSVDPPDLSTQIEQLRFRGEGDTLEFKEQTPTDKDKSQMLKTIAAFANGDGGVILFGIEDGTGTMRGLSVDAAKESDRLTQMIRTNVVPQPEFRIRHAQVKGKLVLALFVDPGEKPPYGIHPEKPEFYVRRAATTFRARQDEVRSLAQTESQSGSVYGGPSPLSRFRRQSP